MEKLTKAELSDLASTFRDAFEADSWRAVTTIETFVLEKIKHERLALDVMTPNEEYGKRAAYLAGQQAGIYKVFQERNMLLELLKGEDNAAQ